MFFGAEFCRLLFKRLVADARAPVETVAPTCVAYSTFQQPDFPPCFSITLMSDITIVLSTALHLS